MAENNHIIGIGELAASARSEITLKTFGLGSCVALILYDPVKLVGGMVHVALPDSTLHLDHKVQRVAEGYYADRGVDLLLRHIGRLRGAFSTAGLCACLVGGASVLPNSRRFYIGQRNVLKLREMLQKLSIPIRAEDTGDELSRTVFFDVGSGMVTVASPGRKHIVIPLNRKS